MKKYELTAETKVVFGRTLYRIRALIAFGNVDAGEKGGWIEKESNLDQYGNAWVYGNARVYGDAEVYGNAAIMTVSHIGSRFGTTTFFALKGGNIGVSCGCFRGNIDEFTAAVERTHGDTHHGKAYKIAIELAKLQIKTAEKENEQ